MRCHLIFSERAERVQRCQKGRLIQALAILAKVLLAVAVSVGAFSQSTASGPPGLDKVFHAVAFAALAFPMAFARPKYVWWVVGAAAAYGGVIELVQPHVGRQAEWLDFVSDVAGASLGGFIGAKLGTLLTMGVER